MTRTRPEYTEEQRAEIDRALKEKRNGKDYRRLLILKAAGDKSRTNEDLARDFQVSVSMVGHLLGDYFKKGLAGILTHIVGGNHRNLSKEKEEELLRKFLARAEKGEILEVAQIWQEYEKELGRPVVASVIYRMLKRHKWRKVMPRSQHPKKASPEEIESYKKNRGTHQNAS